MSADLEAATARAAASRFRGLADSLDAVAGTLPGATTGWSGPAAAAAAHLLSTRPDGFLAAAGAFSAASAALSRHAEALGPVVALHRQAEQAPAEVRAVQQRRAADLADESARQAAAELLALAGSAPRPGRLRRGWQRVDGWRGEVVLGAAESTEALAGMTLKVLGRLTDPFHRPAPSQARQVADAVVDAVEHPVQTGQAVLDWDTWRTNPARAAGHLVPDLVSALASGGTASAVRATTTAAGRRAALESALARQALRRESTASRATASRLALVKRAQAEARAGVGAWRGEGGVRLTPMQNAAAEAFHELSTARESLLTATMAEIARSGRGRLVGLDHRIKELESHKRKIATAFASTGAPLPALLARAEDAVRYTVVIADSSYVRGVGQVAAALEQRGFHLVEKPRNAWLGSRYRGVNSTWLDPATGAAFEVQFHTPASWRITRQTHGLYEEYRLPEVSAARKVELHDLIAAEYRKAPRPAWVGSLGEGAFPPPAAIDPVLPPVDYTVHASVIGAAGAHLAVVEPRLTAGRTPPSDAERGRGGPGGSPGP